MQYSLILSIGRTFMRINCYVCRRVIMKYLLCILSLAFLLVGVGLFSNEEDLQGFREETGVPVLCDVSPTGFSSAPAEHYDFGILTAFSLPRNYLLSVH